MKPKPRHPGRPRLTQTQRVLNAVARGHVTTAAIARSSRVPRLHVQPLLHRLRQEGRIEGVTGMLRVVPAAPVGTQGGSTA